ncbi:hypothetical protein CkaCkLH20_03760 [Colletotrichum karsti]|uniref:Cytochrome P450 n=1 Tax=Colletotrichum karsti TaxID=1095194 RepID=A0A9P6IH73_9PEZI|nr:uncharacterized protein CkaCkLH20_03760 [Colletotrichum karsti]KAF9878860.1 hypothetical protein CkaCkLH20_03760 [Colletotrichum karsti]
MRNPIPGPRFPLITRLQAIYHDLRGNGAQHLDKLHQKYGPIVQTGPKRLSVGDASGLRDVYLLPRRLDRPAPLSVLHNYGSENLVSTVDGDLHQDRRGPLRNVFAVGAIESERVQGGIANAVKHLIERLDAHAGADSEPVDLRPLLRAALQDAMSVVVYGHDNALSVQKDEKQRVAMKIDNEWQRTRFFNMWTLIDFYLPGLALQLHRARLAPKTAYGYVPKDIYMNKVGRRALERLRDPSYRENGADTDTMIFRLVSKFQSEGPSAALPSDEYILSDCLDHFWAGVITTLDALLPTIEHLSQPENQQRQQRLRQELHSAMDDDHLGPKELSRTLKALPYLDAVLRESIRLRPPIPVALERRVSAREGSIVVHGREVPEGWNVSAAASVLHHSQNVFEKPEEWCPERWLVEGSDESEMRKERARVMKRHFFAFGSGSRMCIGVNVAWSIMRQVIAAIYGGMETRVDKGLKQKTRLGREWKVMVRLRNIGSGRKSQMEH